jgi:hypothetical protein
MNFLFFPPQSGFGCGKQRKRRKLSSNFAAFLLALKYSFPPRLGFSLGRVGFAVGENFRGFLFDIYVTFVVAFCTEQ